MCAPVPSESISWQIEDLIEDEEGEEYMCFKQMISLKKNHENKMT